MKSSRVGIRLGTWLLAAAGLGNVLAAAAAETAESVAVARAACERARQAKIAPLRGAEIAKCKASGRNDPLYCERYWADYGDATRRPDGRMTPRLFDDLPECAAARAAEARARRLE